MFAVPDNTIASAAVAPTVHPALIARQFAADRRRWAHLLRYDPDERYVALVHRVPGQEVWLMSWLPGQGALPHDHGASTGAFTVVSGELTEHVLRDGSTRRLVAGQSRVFAPGYVHRVRNDGPDPAVSLHVYRAERTVRDYPVALSRVS
ncbi:cysteine dioxygenase [Actinophytocola xinjiangensis]|uniref:Cysteine dioxygenase n=1 Tax=Actinophytocola xinjiangensis TaxID=485602 RepID=A0A7Z0WME9_9PSEU|nr:cysteine dioxygenase family protein [Actinophytocola xinjiangensis]OLF08387.1 cysteine dioxygenase [Actinophytocola xinjiangensis]